MGHLIEGKFLKLPKQLNGEYLSDLSDMIPEIWGDYK